MLDLQARARVLPFVAYIAFIFVGDILSRLGVAPEPLRWLYPVKIVVVLSLLWHYRRLYTELCWNDLSIRQVLVACLVGIAVWGLWINLDVDWMMVGASQGFDPRTDDRIDWIFVFLRIAGAALVVPVMEELFWRSFLMRWIESVDFLRVSPGQIKARAFIVTMILFGVEHNLWFAGVVAGAVYGIVYVRGARLSLAVIAHGVTNGILGLWVVLTGQWNFW